MSKQQPVYERVTNSIIEELKHDVVPWVRPWNRLRQSQVDYIQASSAARWHCETKERRLRLLIRAYIEPFHLRPNEATRFAA